MTIQEYIKKHGLVLEQTDVDANPHMADMPSGSRHYKLSIYSGLSCSYTTHFSKGPRLEPGVTLPEILECLQSDFSDFQHGNDIDFETWAENLGYDIDSRRAFKTFETLKAQAIAFIFALGRKAFNDLAEIEF